MVVAHRDLLVCMCCFKLHSTRFRLPWATFFCRTSFYNVGNAYIACAYPSKRAALFSRGLCPPGAIPLTFRGNRWYGNLRPHLGACPVCRLQNDGITFACNEYTIPPVTDFVKGIPSKIRPYHAAAARSAFFAGSWAIWKNQPAPMIYPALMYIRFANGQTMLCFYNQFQHCKMKCDRKKDSPWSLECVEWS